ncbi:MAG: trehalose-phosphatase [Variibacter sp.]|nr:trehalose-phosphatase [Variibacter sp.]
MPASEHRLGGAGPVLTDRLDSQKIALLLDVDGTLIEIAATPQEVHVPPSLKHTLSRLRDQLGGALCLVSGRPIADLDGLFAPLRVPIVGGHGAENRLTADGSITHARAAPLDPDLKRRLLTIAADTPGIIAENKEYSLALHYRLVPEQEKFVRAEIARVCAACPPGAVEVLPGKSVFEVKPRAFNKGTAVQALMRKAPFKGRVPIFIGDDVTDESVFAVLPHLGGRGYSVGRELNGAVDYFGTPREVRHWLYELLRSGATAREGEFA